ncbi:NAD kinase b isoform X2 [Esox lucius]|nr:NAD kinase b isoform X2 [Esox lucius]XP_010889792.2 NAD kinase b isoform X2 [Esox lucius]XP_010889802.2 NAD kinase b isoform X2 [Esox lucius]
MEDSQESSCSSATPERGSTPPGISSSSKHRKSSKRRWEGKRSQHHHKDDQESLLLPDKHKHSDLSGSSAAEMTESSPKRRAHFLHGPYPATHFGPKACILPNPTSVMHIQDPASQRLTWNKPPVNVLVIRKIRDESLVEPFKELCWFLVEEKQMMVYVERRVVEDIALTNDEGFGSIRNQLCTFREGYDDISDCIDLIICLGGDGTLLYASSLFQGSVPPVMAFHLGSLGFLTPFKFESYKTEVAKVFEGNAAITLRSRLKVKVVKDLLQRTGLPGQQQYLGLEGPGCVDQDLEGPGCVDQDLEGPGCVDHGLGGPGCVDHGLEGPGCLDQGLEGPGCVDLDHPDSHPEAQPDSEHNGLPPHDHTNTEPGKVTLQMQVLNEVVVDRGPSSYLSNVDLYLDGRLITSVQGDGVIVSTPTGSTAYAAAAGASMIHPNVPAIMVTPICPHSLSFRPIVVPAGVELMITLSPDARNTCWVSFDGRKRQEIRHGDCIKITTSCYPLPSICCHDLVYDWFESLAQCLHWNVRKKQARLADDVSQSSDTEN